MPKIGQDLFKKGNLLEKEHTLNEILHFCHKKGTKNKDFGEKMLSKNALKQKVKKKLSKKGTPGVQDT